MRGTFYIFALVTFATFFLAACSREMTDGEKEYSSQILTRGINFDNVTFLGWLSEDQKKSEALEQIRKENEVISQYGSSDEVLTLIPSLFGADAIAIGNKIIFENYLMDFSTSIFDSDRWLMAHELVHVWQWQNRERLDYSFSKVVSEHIEYGDGVYDYVLISGKRFTEYRFEQQGSIVQCYAQLRQTMPNSPITKEHEKLIRSEFPLDEILKILGSDGDEFVRIRTQHNLDNCNS